MPHCLVQCASGHLAGCGLSPECLLAWSLGEAEGSGEGQSASADIVFRVPGSISRPEAGPGQDGSRPGQDMSPSHCAVVGPGRGSHFSAALAVHASALASSEYLQNLPFLFFFSCQCFFPV